jgi:hypothetical protein
MSGPIASMEQDIDDCILGCGFDALKAKRRVVNVESSGGEISNLASNP